MARLARSLKKIGDRPFAPFDTLETYSTSMTTFATSAEKLTNALNNIDGEYVGSEFYAIGEGIEYMVEQMDRLNIGDMLKVGAMKLFGPSKEEKEEEVRKSSARTAAKDALYGFDSMEMTGLAEILDKMTIQGSGYKNSQSQAAKVLDNLNPAKLSQFGIDIDKSKLNMGSVPIGSRSAEEWEEITKIRNEEVKRVTQLLKQKVDELKLQEDTGIIAPLPLQQPTATVDQNAVPTGQAKQQVDAYKMQEQTSIDQNAVPTVGQQPQIEEDSTNTGSAQNTLAEFKPESQSMEAELDMPTLLAELVRLQTENNRLLKKEIDSINSLDV
jgi:hypothetical protein